MTPVTPPVELRHDVVADSVATGALAVATVGFRVVRDDLEPSRCRICDGTPPGGVNAIDDWFRRTLVHDDTAPAQVTSYVLAFGLAPLSGALLSIFAATNDQRGDEALVDVLAVAEGGFAAMLTTEVLESVTLRQRPLVHAIADDREREKAVAEGGAFHSFPAGHVVEAFGVATAAGVVASLRGYRLAPLVWGVGLVIGVATAYTRVAADRHYFTDTLAGAGIGALVGGGVPLLFHRRSSAASDAAAHARLFVAPIPSGRLLGVAWAF